MDFNVIIITVRPEQAFGLRCADAYTCVMDYVIGQNLSYSPLPTCFVNSKRDEIY